VTATERAILRLGLDGDVADRIRDAYSEPHRRYHDLRHLEEVVGGIEGADDEILLAALFHDAVYDARRNDNEARSAELMRDLVPHAGDRAVQAILATQTHQTDDPAVELLLDADLAVLGRPWDGYAEYAAEIRAEYNHVPDDAFRTGRAGVLRRFLERPRIFRTERFALLETLARQNLERELRQL